MKWAHQGILHVRSMEQSKGVYECERTQSRTYILARPGGWRGCQRRLKDFILFQKCRVGFCKMNAWLGPRFRSGHNRGSRDLQHVVAANNSTQVLRGDYAESTGARDWNVMSIFNSFFILANFFLKFTTKQDSNFSGVLNFSVQCIDVAPFT